MTNQQLVRLLKAAITEGGATAGIAEPQDANEFIDLTVDQTAILQQIRVESGIIKSQNVDSLNLMEPVLQAATENTEATNVYKPDENSSVLTPTEKIAAFDVTFSYLRKNIEGEDVNETLNNLYAKRVGKDVVLAAFEGDTAGPTGTRTEKAKASMDGFVKLLENDSDVHDVVISATPDYLGTEFPAMVKALPKEYRDDREALGFFVSADVYDSYADEIGARATALGDQIIAGPWKSNLSYKGIKLFPVYGLETDNVILTLRQNLVVGFGQELMVGRDINNRARRLEVTMTLEVDTAIVEGDAAVLGQPA